jgi:hypothetical protein
MTTHQQQPHHNLGDQAPDKQSFTVRNCVKKTEEQKCTRKKMEKVAFMFQLHENYENANDFL